ncbi:lysylphosphatidylglycerol synthase transmembrane domain-containing protein [Neomoorella thermoacetica]|uniref:lysylphosphatidylglycerol synthase transmembrane domain-containing protein n=1 Tax=Neomoorella thermoacetica TaxID=1525 RepID=UPI0008FB2ADF|nr:lysylphosphatidylglycerol synthase transmembrane domain-containing protein [Moorella thermoacetica]APC08683.1 hypothetical protein MTJW_15240 [Moorella thermoacetica]
MGAEKMKAGYFPPGDRWQDGVWLLAALILSGAGLWTVERGISWDHFRLFLTHFHFCFLLGALLVAALLFIAEAIRVQVILHLVGESLPLGRALQVALSTAFALGITPFGVGGPPVQTYLLKRSGIPLEKSLTVAATQAAWTVGFFVPVLPLAVRVGYGKTAGREELFLILFGLTWLAFLTACCYLLVTRPHLVYILTFKLTGILPPGLVPRRRFLARRVMGELLRLSRTVKLVFNSGAAAILKVTLWTAVIWGALFVMGPLLLLGLGVHTSWLVLIARQIVIYFIISTVPLPGGSGLAELGAATVFRPLLPGSLLPGFIAAWRFFTYYLQLLVGGPILWYSLRSGQIVP